MTDPDSPRKLTTEEIYGEIRAIKKESEYVKDLLIKIKRLEDQNVRLRQGNGELISKLLKYEKQGI